MIFFFFIVCFSFFSPPSCQPSSTWIELFDLRAAVLKEEGMPPHFVQHLPPAAVPSAPSFSCKHLSNGGRREGTGPGQDFPSWAGASTPALIFPRPHLLCTHSHSASLGTVMSRILTCIGDCYMSSILMSFAVSCHSPPEAPCLRSTPSTQGLPPKAWSIAPQPVCSAISPSGLPFPSRTSFIYRGISISSAW